MNDASESTKKIKVSPAAGHPRVAADPLPEAAILHTRLEYQAQDAKLAKAFAASAASAGLGNVQHPCSLSNPGGGVFADAPSRTSRLGVQSYLVTAPGIAGGCARPVAGSVLALEFATGGGSMAWVRDGAVTCEREWPGETRRRPETFADLQALLEQSGVDLGTVDLLAVGVGPGSFSGLRMAVSFLRGLALPDGKPVLAVSSAEALAFDVFREQPAAARVVVLGDARRGDVWSGVFERADERVERRGDWVVAPLERLPAELVLEGSVWVTSDWDRLGARLGAACPAGVRLIEGARRPRAAAVAELVRRRAAAGLAGEPLVPIYLHPAVRV